MYKVVDEIMMETLQFRDQLDAEMEAERRLMRHRTGYSVRRTYIPPIKAKLIIEGEVYRICLK